MFPLGGEIGDRFIKHEDMGCIAVDIGYPGESDLFSHELHGTAESVDPDSVSTVPFAQ